VFPLRDENPTLLTPVITISLIVMNVLVWLYVEGAGYSSHLLGETVCRLGLIPAEVTGLTGGYTGVQYDASMPACAFGGLAVSSIFTSMFLHGGWLHLIGNMWFLWLFGDNTEAALGHFRFFLFYVIVGVAAALTHIFSAPASVIPTVGASGAISGIMGAYLVLYPRARVQTIFVFIFIIRIIAVPAWVVLIMWFLLQALSASAGPLGADAGGVAVWAHIGGFITGVFLIRLFMIGRPRVHQLDPSSEPPDNSPSR
jgi:membrane associated rhomboid family serine protease